MYRNMAQLYRNNQIIDVTKECTFQWDTSVYNTYRNAYLQVKNATGNFTEDEIIENTTDGTSTAKVFDSYIEGNRVYLYDISGSFNSGDQIKGQSSRQTATVEAYFPYVEWPNNKTKGTFPDSFLNDDPEDYLEIEATTNGAKCIGRLYIKLPGDKDHIACIIPEIGVGNKICSRNFSTKITCTFNPFGYGWKTEQKQLTKSPMNSEVKFGIQSPIGFSKGFFSAFYFRNYDKGTVQWRIYNIKVLKLVI